MSDTERAINSDINDVLSGAHEVWVEGMRKEMGIPADWIYRRTPHATDDALRQLFELLGEGHYRIVSGISRNGGGSFSVFTSPEGMRRAVERAAQNKVKP